MRAIHSTSAPAALGPYSQAVFINNTLYVSGVLGIDPYTKEIAKTFAEQVDYIFQYAHSILTAAGMSFSNVVKCTIYLKDMDNFETLNKIYAGFFNEPFPARETVEISQLPKNADLEISYIAAK